MAVVIRSTLNGRPVESFQVQRSGLPSKRVTSRKAVPPRPLKTSRCTLRKASRAVPHGLHSSITGMRLYSRMRTNPTLSPNREFASCTPSTRTPEQSFGQLYAPQPPCSPILFRFTVTSRKTRFLRSHERRGEDPFRHEISTCLESQGITGGRFVPWRTAA